MPILPNNSIDYHSSLSDRRFEEFIRDLYLQDIQEGKYGNKFDDITLLDGIKEQGRDCILHKDKKNVGVIQCKLNGETLSKPESVREIIKFCLYALSYPEFIHDINTFEYHFVAPGGFKNEALLLLQNFSDKILNEEEIDKWIYEVITKFKSFADLNFDDIRSPLYDILSNLQVFPIIRAELDRRLFYNHNQNLFGKYFEVKIVVDNSVIIESLDEIKTSQSLYSDDLLKELRAASCSLYMCKNYFGDLHDSNIQRKETKEILNWIKLSLQPNSSEEKENVLFLSGTAGCGKTTILKELYELLVADNVLVLGLKSDVLVAHNLEELQLKINFSHSITRSLIEISKKHDKVVLLIDQIDALSQYLSANRDYINTYIQLIESLKQYLNIRIIVSVREYDLNYDLALHAYKKNKKIEVGNLPEKDVEFVLNKLKLSKDQLSDTLFQLLENPNNLDVFCRIYNKSTNIHDIKTLQDLYMELWVQLSGNEKIDKENLASLLYAIVEKQSEEQSISLPLNTIIEHYPIEFNFLKSRGIIIEEENGLRFFHQTFYDHVFAKKFIEKGGNVIDYIKTHGQSLAIRSSLKMIYSYIALFNREEYIRITTYILKSNTIRFHIKSLILSLLANVESPLDDEKRIILNIIKPKKPFFTIFIGNLKSKGWASWCIENDVLKEFYSQKPNKWDHFFAKKTKISEFILHSHCFKGYIPYDSKRIENMNLATFLLRQNLKTNSSEILNFLDSFEFENKGSVVCNILYFNENWNCEIAYNLFEKYKKSMNSFLYYHTLGNIVHVNIDFVFNEIRDKIYEKIIATNFNRNDEYEIKELLDLLKQVSLEKSIEFLYEVILTALKSQEYLWTREEDRLLIPDAIFTSFSVVNNRNDHHTDTERIYARLIRWLKEIQSTNYPFFKSFVEKNYNSKYQSILRIVLIILDTPRQEDEKTVIAIIERLYKINKINDQGEFQGDLHKLIQLWFPSFNDKNKTRILDILLSLKDNGELAKWEKGGETAFYSSYGLTTYLFLQALPLDYVYANKKAKQVYQELERKFPKDKPDDHLFNSRFRAGGVSSPIKSRAYEKMTKEQWIKSFIKYDKDEILRDFVGGKEQHAERLTDEIKKRPNNFVDLICEMIADKRVHSDYITQVLYAFSECDLCMDTLTDIFVRAIAEKRYSEDRFTYILTGIRRLFKKGVENQSLIDFIVNLALTYANPENKNKDLRATAINSVRGLCIEALYILDPQKHGRLVFETMEAISKNANDEILSSIVCDIAYLNKYDIEKSFQLFLSIIENASDELFVYSFKSAQYYVHYDFPRLRKYVERSRTIENESFRRNISAMLYYAWLRNYTDSEKLLFDHVGNDSNCIGELIHRAVRDFYFESDTSGKKALYILNKYLHLSDKKIVHQYDCCFLHYKESNIKFDDLYAFAFKYVNSNAFNSKTYYVLDYLLENSSTYPDECFSIFKNMKFEKLRKEPESEYTDHVKEKQIELLMGFYNIFKFAKKRAEKKKSKYIDKLFDELFEDVSYKKDIDKVLDLATKV